jgi:hypothetical protein
VNARQIDWSDQQWSFRDDSNTSAIQYTPSTMTKIFLELAEFNNALQASNKSSDNTDPDADVDRGDKSNESEDEEELFDGSKDVAITLDGIEYKYSVKQLPARQFDALMNILTPVTHSLDLQLEY